MPAPTMSHLIATSALIILIFTMQVFYFYVVDNIGEEMTRRKLKEIADYVSDTIANLYFLVNSTNHPNVTLQKTLNLPTEIADSSYRIQILKNDTDGSAKSVLAFLEDKSWLNANSWLLPGLKVQESFDQILINGTTILAGCERIPGNTNVWLAYE